jgi:hypothetical protein
MFLISLTLLGAHTVPKRIVFEKVDKHLSTNQLLGDVFARIRMLQDRNRKIFRQKGILTIGNIAKTNQAVTGSES